MLFFKDCTLSKGTHPRKDAQGGRALGVEWALRSSQSQMMWGLVQIEGGGRQSNSELSHQRPGIKCENQEGRNYAAAAKSLQSYKLYAEFRRGRPATQAPLSLGFRNRFYSVLKGLSDDLPLLSSDPKPLGPGSWHWDVTFSCGVSAGEFPQWAQR